MKNLMLVAIGICYSLHLFPGTFIPIAHDPDNDCTCNCPDLAALSFRFDLATDSVWFKIKTYGARPLDYGYYITTNADQDTATGDTRTGGTGGGGCAGIGDYSVRHDRMIVVQPGIARIEHFDTDSPGVVLNHDVFIKFPDPFTTIINTRLSDIDLDGDGRFDVLAGSGASGYVVWDVIPDMGHIQTFHYDVSVPINHAPFNGDTRLLSMNLPDSFDLTASNTLLLGLPGQGHQASELRDILQEVSDSANCVVACLAEDDLENQVIPALADSLVRWFAIDTARVFLFGHSAGGAGVLNYAKDDIYEFKGLIPFNPIMSGLEAGDFNHLQPPVCMCSAAFDPYHNDHIATYDSMHAAGRAVYLNTIPGQGHVIPFPGFTAEVLECLDFIAASISTGKTAKPVGLTGFRAFPNPLNGRFTLQFYLEQPENVVIRLWDAYGREIYRSAEQGEQWFRKDIEVPGQNGLFLLLLQTDNGTITQNLVKVE